MFNYNPTEPSFQTPSKYFHQGNAIRAKTYMSSNYDQKTSGKIYDWIDWKKRSLAIAIALLSISKRATTEGESLMIQKRYNRVSSCGTRLMFATDGKESGSKKKLISANFCRDRFCPHCQKRRSLVLFAQNKQLVEAWIGEVEKNKAKPAFLLLTLTIPNCSSENLGDTITEMLQGFMRLFKRKELDCIKGFLRTLEVTHNAERGDYHPHIHVLLAVHESYFGKYYVSQQRWLDLWQESLRREDVKVIDVRRITGKKKGQADLSEDTDDALRGVLETAKYCTKPSDYLIFDNGTSGYRVDSSVLEVLMKHLKGRRLIAYGRAFDKIRKELKLQDEDRVDLVKTGAEIDKEEFKPLFEELWHWTEKTGRYFLVESKEIDQ